MYPPDATEPEVQEQRRIWKEKQLKSRLDFVQYHAIDPRALDVLYQTTVEMYDDKSYNDVVHWVAESCPGNPRRQPKCARIRSF